MHRTETFFPKFFLYSCCVILVGQSSVYKLDEIYSHTLNNNIGEFRKKKKLPLHRGGHTKRGEPKKICRTHENKNSLYFYYNPVPIVYYMMCSTSSSSVLHPCYVCTRVVRRKMFASVMMRD